MIFFYNFDNFWQTPTQTFEIFFWKHTVEKSQGSSKHSHFLPNHTFPPEPSLTNLWNFLLRTHIGKSQRQPNILTFPPHRTFQPKPSLTIFNFSLKLPIFESTLRHFKMPWLLPKWSQFTVLSWVTFSDICSNRPTGPQVHKIRPHQTRSRSGKNIWITLMLYNLLKVPDFVVFSHLKQCCFLTSKNRSAEVRFEDGFR